VIYLASEKIAAGETAANRGTLRLNSPRCLSDISSGELPRSVGAAPGSASWARRVATATEGGGVSLRRVAMRLSAEMYKQIVEGLKSDSHPSREKRREPRVGMAGEVEFVTMDETGKCVDGLVKIRDVSRSGVGLLCTKKFAAQQRFVVQLLSAKREPIWLVCTTAYCRRVQEERFSIGGRIIQLLLAEQIQQIEAKAAVTQCAASARKFGKEDQADIARISRAILG